MQAAAARQQHQQHSQHQSIDSAHQPPGIPSPRPVPREEHFQHQQQRSFPNGEALLEHMQQHMPLQPPINQYQHQHQRHPHPHPHPPQSQPAMELQALLDRNGRMRFPDPIAMPPPPPPPQYIDSQARVAVMGQQLAASRQDMLFQELMIQQHQQHQQMLQQQTDVPSMFHLAPEEKEVVVANAHRRIQEAELLEAKRRRKAAKISEYVRLLYPILIFLTTNLLLQVAQQRPNDSVRQGFHNARASCPARYLRSLFGRLLRAGYHVAPRTKEGQPP